MRRTAAATLVGALVLGGCQSLPQRPGPLPETFIPEVTPSAGSTTELGFTALERVALRVRVRTCTEYATGSAWMLDETHAVTNKHVIDGATDITLTGYDGHVYTVSASVIDTHADLALMTIDGTFPEAAQLAADEPEPEMILSVAGYPDGEALETVSGAFVGATEDTLDATTDPVYEARIEIHPGNSGSPLADPDGNVVGVIYAGDGVGWAYAMSLPTLEGFLGDTGRQQRNTADCDS